MAKKKRETKTVDSPSIDPTPPDAETTDQPATTAPSPSAGQPLRDEVQAFLNQRAELAQKLAEEIAATEQKLAELKKTAALLFPENQSAGAGLKDRKAKKAKAKPAARDEKIETPELPADSAPVESAA